MYLWLVHLFQNRQIWNIIFFSSDKSINMVKWRRITIFFLLFILGVLTLYFFILEPEDRFSTRKIKVSQVGHIFSLDFYLYNWNNFYNFSIRWTLFYLRYYKYIKKLKWCKSSFVLYLFFNPIINLTIIFFTESSLMLFQISRIFDISWPFVYFLSPSLFFIFAQIFSIGFRSGELGGQFKTFISLW